MILGDNSKSLSDEISAKRNYSQLLMHTYLGFLSGDRKDRKCLYLEQFDIIFCSMFIQCLKSSHLVNSHYFATNVDMKNDSISNTKYHYANCLILYQKLCNKRKNKTQALSAVYSVTSLVDLEKSDY